MSFILFSWDYGLTLGVEVNLSSSFLFFSCLSFFVSLFLSTSWFIHLRGRWRETIKGEWDDEGWIWWLRVSQAVWKDHDVQEGVCWGLVFKCYELRTRQHKNRLMVNALRPSKHYFPKDITIFGRRLWRTYLHNHSVCQWKTKYMKHEK
jgi:hypothetical protein